MFTNKEFWNQIMKQIKEDFFIQREDEFNLWFGGIKYVGTTGITITVEVPSMFFKNQIIKREYVDILQKKINGKFHKAMLLDLNLKNVSFPNQIVKAGGLDG